MGRTGGREVGRCSGGGGAVGRSVACRRDFVFAWGVGGRQRHPMKMISAADVTWLIIIHSTTQIPVLLPVDLRLLRSRAPLVRHVPHGHQPGPGRRHRLGRQRLRDPQAARGRHLHHPHQGKVKCVSASDLCVCVCVCVCVYVCGCGCVGVGVWVWGEWMSRLIGWGLGWAARAGC